MKVVVLGGAGYIGSHFCRVLSDMGSALKVIDDFSTGNEWAVADYECIRLDILDTEQVAKVIANADAVCHFAAKSCVADSIMNPTNYFKANVEGTRSVLSAMTKSGVRKLVFSSTAAVYGSPIGSDDLLTEDCVCDPINPYGQSKLEAEELIKAWATDGHGSAVSFRYFNAAGACPELGLGEAHDPETHLIPNVLNSLIGMSDRPFELFGDDYPSPDGTCIRDYVHVKDIADAHLRGLMFHAGHKNSFTVCNLGSSAGYSNREVVRMCEYVSGRTLDTVVKGRRPGDPTRLVASRSKAKELFGWEPLNSDLYNIVATAYQWHRNYAASQAR